MRARGQATAAPAAALAVALLLRAQPTALEAGRERMRAAPLHTMAAVPAAAALL